MDVIVRCPLRVSFGGCDEPEYSSIHGGLAVCSALRNAHVEVRLTKKTSDGPTRFQWESGDVGHPAVLALAESIADCVAPPQKTVGYVRGSKWFGAGLGASSALAVAIVRGFAALESRELDDCELFRRSYKIERLDLGLTGGYQDHLCAAIGGSNIFWIKNSSQVLSKRLIIGNNVGESLFMVDSGKRRNGSKRLIHARHRDSRRYLDLSKQAGLSAVKALNIDDPALLSEAFKVSWTLKDKAGLIPPGPKSIMAWGMTSGATAGRLLGAGGGGHVLLIVEEPRRAQFIRDARVAGVGLCALSGRLGATGAIFNRVPSDERGQHSGG